MLAFSDQTISDGARQAQNFFTIVVGVMLVGFIVVFIRWLILRLPASPRAEKPPQEGSNQDPGIQQEQPQGYTGLYEDGTHRAFTDE